VLELVFLYRKTSVNRNRSFQKFGSYLSKFWRVKLRVKLDFWGLKRYTGGGERNLQMFGPVSLGSWAQAKEAQMENDSTV
jgi:hypothetical protein